MLTVRPDQDGFTLIELLVASALALTVAIGIATMESGRVQMQEEIIARSGLASDQGQVALTTVQLAERIAMADWVTINNGGGVFRFRIPSGCATPACLNNPASYRWDQYRLAAGVLTLFTDVPGCGTVRTLASNVTGLTLTQAGNEIAYVLTWNNGFAGDRNRTHEFRGQVASRALASPGGPLAAAPGPPGAC